MWDKPDRSAEPNGVEAIAKEIGKLPEAILESVFLDNQISGDEAKFLADKIGMNNPTADQLAVIAQKAQQIFETRHKNHPGVTEGVKEGAQEVGEVLKGTVKGISSADSIGRAESTPTTQKDKGREI